jgi:hypothetical protein
VLPTTDCRCIQGQIVHADAHMRGPNQANDVSLLNSGTALTKRGDDTADFPRDDSASCVDYMGISRSTRIKL